MARSARALPTAVLAAALLAGCGMAGDDGAAPSASDPGVATPVGPAPTPTPEDAPSTTSGTTAGSVRAGGVPVGVGGRTVLHAQPVAAHDAVTTGEDGDLLQLRVTAAPGGAAQVLLTAPAGGTLVLQDDGSFTVLSPDGGFLGGASRPVTVPDGGGVTVTEAGDGLVLASAGEGDLLLTIATRALAATDWGEREGGRSLAVTPTPWARMAGLAGELGVWTELVAAVPEADTQVMRDQLTCHALGAPDKATWNLEPWRPDVGLFAVLAAACNPT